MSTGFYVFRYQVKMERKASEKALRKSLSGSYNAVSVTYILKFNFEERDYVCRVAKSARNFQLIFPMLSYALNESWAVDIFKLCVSYFYGTS